MLEALTLVIILISYFMFAACTTSLLLRSAAVGAADRLITVTSYHSCAKHALVEMGECGGGMFSEETASLTELLDSREL